MRKRLVRKEILNLSGNIHTLPVKCVVMKYFAKKQKQIMDGFISSSQEYAKWFGDTVGGVREVKLFNVLKY